MRIGLSSIVGDGFGTGSFQISEIAGEISFPAAGTILETLTNQTFPIPNGGGAVTYNGTQYPNQNADVYRKANGTGGNYLDWANAFNIAYKTGYFASSSSYSSPIIINGTNYGAGCSYSADAEHDGSGGYTEVNQQGSCANSGQLIVNDGTTGSESISTPVGSYAWKTWTSTSYYHDGSGGYYSEQNGVTTQNSGAFIGNDSISGSNSIEVPSGSGYYFTTYSWTSKDYYYNGSGGYYTTDLGTFSANYGDYIRYDGTYTYYYDGAGGYYY